MRLLNIERKKNTHIKNIRHLLPIPPELQLIHCSPPLPLSPYKSLNTPTPSLSPSLSTPLPYPYLLTLYKMTYLKTSSKRVLGTHTHTHTHTHKYNVCIHNWVDSYFIKCNWLYSGLNEIWTHTLTFQSYLYMSVTN